MLWLDDVEQSEFAQLEEPFAVIHKCTLQGILEEWKRDAAPQPGGRRSGLPDPSLEPVRFTESSYMY